MSNIHLYVVFSSKAEKQLFWLPRHIVSKLKSWVSLVEKFGMNATRKIPGYHDEPLQGSRLGQRSIRLSKSYRAFYFVDSNKVIIIEINKHEY